MRRVLIILVSALLVASLASLFMVLNILDQRYPLPTSQELDSQLGGKWQVVAEGSLDNTSGLSKILSALAEDSQNSYFASYKGEDQILTVFVFKLHTNYTDSLLYKIREIYTILNWSVRPLNETPGFYISSPQAQYVYAGYKEWIVVIYINGTQVRPGEELQVLSLALNQLD